MIDVAFVVDVKPVEGVTSRCMWEELRQDDEPVDGRCPDVADMTATLILAVPETVIVRGGTALCLKHMTELIEAAP